MAACNPYRDNSLTTHKSSWLRGTYYVRSLYPTLKLLMWEYGSLDMHQERDYINAKMKMINKDMTNPEVGVVCTCSHCQTYFSTIPLSVILVKDK